MSNEAATSGNYFLSYSRADERFALRFATDIRGAGVPMWVDQLDIRPSEHWDRAIERAVRDCRGIVVILSPRSAASDNVADEISFAIDNGKSVLPVMIERCPLPLRITRMQVIDATTNYERALQQCLDVFCGGEPRQSERTPVSAGIGDAEVVAAAKKRLTQIVGPIASILVERAAARAGSSTELYGLLAQHIENEKDRERFLIMGGAPERTPVAPPATPSGSANPGTVTSADVDRLTGLLAHYLGPMATVIARRETAAAASPDELKQRLASRIPHERERADFLRRANG